MSIKIISRSKGRSAVAAAAYRAGEIIKNDWDGMTHDYTRKVGIAHTEILLPNHAPSEYSDRSTLWNAVEKIEKNSNAQLAREIELALPVELSQEQNIELVRAYCQRHFVAAGMCADICVHDKNDGNPHAHVMLTMRPFEGDGSWAAKSKKEYIFGNNGQRIRLKRGAFKTRKVCTTDWNEQTKAEQWRFGWADMVNAALEKNDVAARIDHRSYKRQSVDIKPTIHLGVAASAMEKRGIRTERGDINREIADWNREIRQTKARIKKVKAWIYAQPLTDAPSMIDMMQGISQAKNLDARWKKIANLKTRAKLLVFLQENGITDMPQLVQKVTDTHERIYEIAGKIKASERRISKLNEHLSQVDTRKQHSAVYKRYKAVGPQKRGAFADKHAAEIAAYEAAAQYLKEHLNGYDKIPEKQWRTERDKLLAERFALMDEFYALKEDVRSMETLRRGAQAVMKQEPQVRRAQEQTL